MNKNSPLISVIIPAYNHENYVQDAIESVISQDYPNLELIILNDGSLDNTSKKIKELIPTCKEKFKSFEYIDKQNEGISKTLNKGIKLSKGIFILILASDDILKKADSISILYNAIKDNHEYVLSCGDAEFINSNTKKIYLDEIGIPSYKKQTNNYETFLEFYTTRIGREDFDYKSKEFGEYKTLIVGNYLPSTVLLKKEAIIKIGLFDEHLALEDWDMWFRLSKKYKFKFTNIITTRYRWHEKNAVKKTPVRLAKNELLILQKEKEYCKKNNLLSVWEETFGNTIKYLVINQASDFIKKTLAPENHEIYVAQLEEVVVETVKVANIYQGLMQHKLMRMFIKTITFAKRIKGLLIK